MKQTFSNPMTRFEDLAVETDRGACKTLIDWYMTPMATRAHSGSYEGVIGGTPAGRFNPVLTVNLDTGETSPLPQIPPPDPEYMTEADKDPFFVHMVRPVTDTKGNPIAVFVITGVINKISPRWIEFDARHQAAGTSIEPDHHINGIRATYDSIDTKKMLENGMRTFAYDFGDHCRLFARYHDALRCAGHALKKEYRPLPLWPLQKEASAIKDLKRDIEERWVPPKHLINQTYQKISNPGLRRRPPITP